MGILRIQSLVIKCFNFYIYRQGNYIEFGVIRQGFGLGVGILEGSGGSRRRVGLFLLLIDVLDIFLGSRKLVMQRMLFSSVDVIGKSFKVNLRAMGVIEEYRVDERFGWICV